MYETFFGLSEHPFRMSPSPDYLMMTQSHREALAGLTYGILGKKGFIVLVGDAGTGKTTVLKQTLRTLPIKASFVVNPNVRPNEFLELVMRGFGIHGIPSSKSGRLIRLEESLSSFAAGGNPPLLVVDEAHLLSVPTLEELRLLTNLEADGTRLLQVVLSGQNELRTLLNRKDLRQIKQRISVRLTLKPLDDAEQVRCYILHRWTRAGGGDELPFEPGAVKAIATCSTGIPRLVNTICDNALLAAYALGSRVVTDETVREVATELELWDGAAPPPPPVRRREPEPRKQAPPRTPTGQPRQAEEWQEVRPNLMPSIVRYDGPSTKKSTLQSWVNWLKN